MRIGDFADMIGATLELRRYPNNKAFPALPTARWLAMFQNCEIGGNGMLEGATGRGTTPREAIRDYAERIQGKHLVFSAFSPYRMEFDAPERLT